MTGGTGGIGQAVAGALTRAGCRVAVTCLPAELESARAIPEFNGVCIHSADVTSAEDVRALFERIDRLDFLVNAAGIIRRDEEFQIDSFQHVLDVNLTGTMRMCMAARELLAASRGCVINIASMLSFFGGARVPAYTASKGGVMQLTKALAVAWAADGIRVNAVAPGWIATPFTQALQDDPERSRAILTRTPMGRWGRPEDVSGAVLFLCSPAASFITGVTLPVDGGYSAM